MRKGRESVRGARRAQATRERPQHVDPAEGREGRLVLRPHLADRHDAAHRLSQPRSKARCSSPLVLLLFLGNLRAAAIVAVVIPLALLATFIGLTLARHSREPAVARRDGLRHHRRRRGHRRRERLPTSVRRHATRHERAARDDHRRDGGGRPADVLLDAHHHRREHSDLHAAAPRRAHLRADGVDDHVRAGRIAAVIADARSPALLLACCAHRFRTRRIASCVCASGSTSPFSGRRCARPARGCRGRRARLPRASPSRLGWLGVLARAQRRNDLGQPQFAAGHFRP